MKYMGSKTWMLSNGLGKILVNEARSANKVYDIFAGSAAVSWFIAEKVEKTVIAVDLQRYSAVLAKAILDRTTASKVESSLNSWIEFAEAKVKNSPLYKEASVLSLGSFSKSYIARCRELCTIPSRVGPVWNAYGGYYFSPVQALSIDYLLKGLPKRSPFRAILHASLIMAASRCAASPGHTAQPLRPTKGGLEHIKDAWDRDVIETTKQFALDLASRHAKKRGRSRIGEAVRVSRGLQKGDLVFIDPPYSDVQYSRFYHVLETIACGFCGPVEGAGRYPAVRFRPQSDFSKRSRSRDAMKQLLLNIAQSGATAIVTFPAGSASNKISGRFLVAMAKKYFSASSVRVSSNFSTLGGNNRLRASRRRRLELILILRPHKHIKMVNRAAYGQGINTIHRRRRK